MDTDVHLVVSTGLLARIERLIGRGLLLVLWATFLMAALACSLASLLVVPSFLEGFTSFGLDTPWLLAEPTVRHAFFSVCPAFMLLAALAFSIAPRQRISVFAALVTLVAEGVLFVATMGIPALLLVTGLHSAGNTV